MTAALTQNTSAFLLALLVTILVTPMVRQRASGWGLLDLPDGKRHHHRNAVPRLGGVVLVVSVVITVVLVTASSAAIGAPLPTAGAINAGLSEGVLFGGLIIFATGVVDDIRGLRPALKLLLQIVAAFVAVKSGLRIESLGIVSGGTGVSTGVLATPLTILWLVAITNAFNFIDGIDGLATLLGITVTATFVCSEVLLYRNSTLIASLAICGGALGFLRFNFYPARIFLGDSGSMSFGFFLAAMGISSTTAGSGSVLVLIPLLALAVPIADLVITVARRWINGMPLSRGDDRHLHHQLLRIGLSQRHTAQLLTITTLALSALGLAITFGPARFATPLVYALPLLILPALTWLFRLLQYREFTEPIQAMLQLMQRNRIHRTVRVSFKGRPTPPS